VLALLEVLELTELLELPQVVWLPYDPPATAEPTSAAMDKEKEVCMVKTDRCVALVEGIIAKVSCMLAVDWRKYRKSSECTKFVTT